VIGRTHRRAVSPQGPLSRNLARRWSPPVPAQHGESAIPRSRRRPGRSRPPPVIPPQLRTVVLPHRGPRTDRRRRAPAPPNRPMPAPTTRPTGDGRAPPPPLRARSTSNTAPGHARLGRCHDICTQPEHSQRPENLSAGLANCEELHESDRRRISRSTDATASGRGAPDLERLASTMGPSSDLSPRPGARPILRTSAFHSRHNRHEPQRAPLGTDQRRPGHPPGMPWPAAGHPI
jgi:hypothetical protein